MGVSSNRKNKTPEPIGELLRSFLAEKLPKNLGDESRIFGAWPRAVGKEISRQARPTAFRNGILFVETRHPVWTAELTSKRHLMLRKLNAAIGAEMVRDIHFRQARD